MDNKNIFAWLTWIENLRSRDYWININNVPESCLPKWYCDSTITRNSISLAVDILKTMQEEVSVYIMLMRADMRNLLEIQNRAQNLIEY